MELSIIIVTMGEDEWLWRCLRSIRETHGSLRVELIVVDNASCGRDLPLSRDIWPGLIALPQSRNVGYVAANNIGLARATAPLVAFLNNDTELHRGCLQALVDHFLQTPDAGAASGQVLNADGTDQGTARRFPCVMNGLFGRRSWLTHVFPKNPWSRRYLVGRFHHGDAPFEVETLSSACMVLRTELAQRLGGMDERFRLYWVDAELCHRVRQAGFKVYCVQSAKITHFEGQGGSARSWRQRCRATIAFHKDAFLAYTKIKQLGVLHPLRWFAWCALSVRMVGLLMVQILRPHRTTCSGGRN
jgi:GT2 family glycosyltransferase